MMLFLFWFIRILCLACFLVDVVVVDVHNFTSFLFFVFGLLAAINIYGIGLLAHETWKSLPSMWILFRAVQLLLIVSAKCVSWHYLALYVGLDILVFALFVYDNKYKFLLKEEGSKDVRTIVDRGDSPAIRKKPTTKKKNTKKKRTGA